MTLIEGVGDEVTDFFIIVGILFIIWIAWCSTSISDQPLIRTVLILQHTHNRITDLRSNQTASLVSNNSELNSEATGRLDTSNTDEVGNICPQSSSSAGTSGDSTESTRETAATSRTEESDAEERPNNSVSTEESIIQAMDSSNGEDPRTFNSEHSDSETNNEIIERVEQVEERPEPEDDNKISIKLKFINDELKLVTASPKEILGDFKRRHFQMELESQKLVRLVFKGQILQPDNLSLERCGLYNNCVVHCLVHQPRTSTSNSSQSSAESTSPLYFNPQNMPTGTGLSTAQQDWDLSKVFLGVLILILGLAWYTRYYYAQHYNVTSTMVLYALTTIFIVTVLSQFFPDEEGLRNIE